MECEHKSLENIHCFKCDKTCLEILAEAKRELREVTCDARETHEEMKKQLAEANKENLHLRNHIAYIHQRLKKDMFKSKGHVCQYRTNLEAVLNIIKDCPIPERKTIKDLSHTIQFDDWLDD